MRSARPFVLCDASRRAGALAALDPILERLTSPGLNRSANRRKGNSVCSNKLPAPMADADAAVLRVVEQTLMHPDVVDRALAHAERAILRERSAGEREAVEAELPETKKAMRRL